MHSFLTRAGHNSCSTRASLGNLHIVHTTNSVDPSPLVHIRSHPLHTLQDVVGRDSAAYLVNTDDSYLLLPFRHTSFLENSFESHSPAIRQNRNRITLDFGNLERKFSFENLSSENPWDTRGPSISTP